MSEKLRNVVRKIGGGLPGASWFRYAVLLSKDKEKKESYGKIAAKLIGHFAYASAALVSGGYYLTASMETGEWNPLEQISVFRERRVLDEIFNRDYEIVFGLNGLADEDGNGEVDKMEKARAYYDMGLEKSVWINFNESIPQKDLTKYIEEKE